MIKKHGADGGQVIVELAFILPIFAIMILGILDFGVVFYNQAMLTNASREGARTAIQWRGKNAGVCTLVPPSEIVAAVNYYLSGQLINFGGAGLWTQQVTRTGDSPACNVTGGTVKVSIQYQHTFLAIPRFILSDPTVNLTAETTMNRE